MCFKKLFPSWFKPDPIPEPITSKKTALLYAINDYPGSANDLNGCLNDQRDIANMLREKFPGFDIRKTIDSDVIMDKILNKPIIALDILINIFNTMSREGTIGELQGTKLGKFYSENSYFKDKAYLS